MRLIAFVGGLLALFLLLGLASQTEKANPNDPRLLAERLDRAYDQLASVPQARAEDIELWITEVAPFFSYEGLDPSVGDFGHEFVNYYFELFNSGVEFNHIAGYTYCDGTVVLNARMAKPISTWYTRDYFLGVLTHEMIHNLRGAYCSMDSVEAESRTQLGMLEVLAAMANQGNLQALKALVGEMRDIASNAYEYQMLKAGKKAEFIDWYVNVMNPGDAFAKAKLLKSYRFWADDVETLQGILYRYSFLVFKDTLDFKFDAWMESDGGASPDKYVVKLDDLRYVLANLESLVASAV